MKKIAIVLVMIMVWGSSSVFAWSPFFIERLNNTFPVRMLDKTARAAENRAEKMGYRIVDFLGLFGININYVEDTRR